MRSDSTLFALFAALILENVRKMTTSPRMVTDGSRCQVRELGVFRPMFMRVQGAVFEKARNPVSIIVVSDGGLTLMGYIKTRCQRFTGSGLRKATRVTAVREAAGQHEWVTTQATGTDGKPVKFASPDHKPFTVYASQAEARKGKAE